MDDQFIVDAEYSDMCEVGGYNDELATLRAENDRLRANLTAMVKRHRESHQNWTQAAVSAQRSGNYSLSVDIQNTALVALSGFPIEEAKEALK